MESLQDIMKTLSLTPTGTEFSKQYTEQEKVQMKCDAYNEGVGDLDKQDGYDCPICKNKGFIDVCIADEYNGAIEYREVMQTCKCHGVRRSIRRLKRSGLESVIRNYTFDKFVAEEEWQKIILNTAKKFCKDQENNWFFIGGGNGCGKTHICTAICGYYMKNYQQEVRYMLWRDDIVPIKAVVNDEVKYQNALRELKEVEVLYIDDFFKIIKGHEGQPLPPTPADIQIAYEIINYRYNNNLATIISSERHIGEILDIDEATGSRMLEKLDEYVLNISKDRSKNQRLRKSKMFNTL